MPPAIVREAGSHPSQHGCGRTDTLSHASQARWVWPSPPPRMPDFPNGHRVTAG